MDASSIHVLPDELLEAIIFLLDADGTLAVAGTCTRLHRIAHEHLVWRRHCIQGWRYWEPRHELRDKLQQPALSVRWRDLYNERRRTDSHALRTFDAMLLTQQHRIQRIEDVSKMGYDVKDLLLRLRDTTPDDADDVLARRYHADVILGQIHRTTALEKWTRLQQRQMVSLEEVLGAYDLFVLAGRKGDLNDIDEELNRLASAVRATDVDFDTFTIRRKALEVAKYLRAHRLVGNPNEENYHDLRNNFLSLALFDDAHTSLPLQSVAIYCAVARRLGVLARPSNYPSHVYAVVEAPSDETLDGRAKLPASDPEPEYMHMDPWRSSDEVPREQLTRRLAHLGTSPDQQASHLGPTGNYEMTLRTGRNIMNSVQEMRDRQRGARPLPSGEPDIESAWYGMLWSMLILGDTNPASALHRRRQCLPYLADHFQNHFPEDLGLIESVITPMFHNEREHIVLLNIITAARAADRNRKAPKRRPAPAPGSDDDGGGQPRIHYKVGQHFEHKRYGYQGMIIGWDFKCSADPAWIEQMRVDDLFRGREQPFYNVIGEDKSHRYVAEENIRVITSTPCDSLMYLAGRHFKRWDGEKSVFVSNIQDEYPED